MNLLDNLTYFLKPGLAVLLIPFFFACDDPTELGLEIGRGDENVIVKDTTLILPASTIYIDSLRTDQYTSTVFGRYSDATFGEITATSNNQYNIGGGTFPADSLDFGSAVLRLKVASVRTQAIASNESLTIYEAADTIFSTGIYLSNRALSKSGSPIAEHSFSFDPEIDSVISVPLNDTFGQSLFSLLVKADSDDDFEDSLLRSQLFFKPLILEPGESNQALYLFDLQDDTSAIYIQMKNPDKPDTTYNFTFDFNNTTRFTSITRDKSGSILNELTSDYAETSVSENTYIDMLAGIHPKIDVTPLIELYKLNEDIIFNSAKLSLEATSTGSSYIEQVNQLRFYFAENDPESTEFGTINATGVQNGNILSNALMTELSYTSPNPANWTLFVTNYNKDEMNYSGNITLFSQTLGGSKDEETGLYLTDHLIALSPAGIGTGQTTFPKSGIKITIYYTLLKE